MVFGRALPPNIRYIAGIDEAGRGPLAGPVSIGIVVVPLTHNKMVVEALSGVRDSKQLSPQRRAWWRKEAMRLMQENIIASATALVGPRYIDKNGIVPAIHLGIIRVLRRLNISPSHTHILLDGGLRAPSYFASQETIIRGDSSELLISLASILAKVRRDNYMVNLSKNMPEYGFEHHKGYGTKEHMRTIKKYGVSSIHRRYFIHL